MKRPWWHYQSSTMATTIPALAAYGLWFFAATIACVNWQVTLRWYRSGQRASMILLASAILALSAAVAHPSVEWYWGLLAIAIDPGCFSLLGLPWLIERMVRRGGRNPSAVEAMESRPKDE